MNKNLETYSKYASVPASAKRKIAGGKLKGITDINPMWRIRALTEEYGPCGFGWYTETVRKWLEHGPDGQVVAFVDIRLYVKRGDEWSQGIEGTGGSKFAALFKGSLETSDEAFKMAETDAISVACKKLGFGADVYWEAGSSKYTNPNMNPEPQPQPPTRHYISQKDAHAVYKELERTGVGLKSLLNYYKIARIEQMQQDAYAECMNMLRARPNKVVAPKEEETEVLETSIRLINENELSELHKELMRTGKAPGEITERFGLKSLLEYNHSGM